MSETDWDVDSHKQEHEHEDHWKLRKNFMLANKDKLPEDELVCMAQVFTNIEFLGCRYPNETMIRVAELAKGVVESYREERKNSLKRTFVAASDAASAKFKGQKRKTEEIEENAKTSNNPVNFVASTSNSSFVNKDSTNSSVIKTDNTNSQSDQPSFKKIRSDNKNEYSITSPVKSKYGGVKTFTINSNRQFQQTKPEIPAAVCKPLKKLNGPFSDFVLFLHSHEENPVATIDRNAAMNKQAVRYESDYNSLQKKFWCRIYMNDQLLSKESGDNAKQTKEAAASSAVQKLQAQCYTVKIKARFFSDSTIDSNLLGVNNKVEDEDDKKLGEDNVGMKMLKLMGWEGGGLGSKKQGIEDPISVGLHVNRTGFGRGDEGNDIKEFKKKARIYVKNWLKSNSNQDLVFSSEFSNLERKAMHEIAGELKLKSKSYGKDEQRHLVICKKPSPWQIVEELADMGGQSDKYELLYPDSYN